MNKVSRFRWISISAVLLALSLPIASVQPLAQAQGVYRIRERLGLPRASAVVGSVGSSADRMSVLSFGKRAGMDSLAKNKA